MSNDAEIVNWESLIASRSRNCERMAEDVAMEARLRKERERNSTPERKKYKQTYDGVGGPGHEGMLERSRRYKERHPEKCKAKQKRYYEEHREQEDERCRLWRRMKKILALATILTTCGDSARHCST